MHIELRKLKIVAALSEETTCYSAEIWVDGQRAFLASNHGHGAADMFHPVGSLSEADVDVWLAANRAPTRFGDTVLKHTLEFEVAALMTRIEEAKRLRRTFRKNLVVIEDGKVWSYPLKGRPAETVASAIKRQKPAARVVNGDDAALEEAITIMIAADELAGGR
ncbi:MULTISPECIES: hypothetical protein [Sphingomonas]|jgi:hypothetical protein|uniref:hypothetical protein n=1 Tax=Sphingomonas TaxID=13687 RepID=UPI0025504A4D|nr:MULTISPECIES: hypothetical protein [Sphingomonas]MDK8187418.1 hypothetical protein [Sphingomonas zeae]MDK8217137.1 hypothetical protein [Sphingomonas sp. UMB7805-LC452B]